MPGRAGRGGPIITTTTRESPGTSPLGERRNRVLLVEDNPTSADLLRRFLADRDAVDEVDVASTGEEALSRVGDGADPPGLPDVVLLDLGLPGKTGHEVLEELRHERGLWGVPVVVVSSSGDPADVERAYELGANGYVRKPAGVEGIQDLARAIEAFWLEQALAPPDLGSAGR